MISTGRGGTHKAQHGRNYDDGTRLSGGIIRTRTVSRSRGRGGSSGKSSPSGNMASVASARVFRRARGEKQGKKGRQRQGTVVLGWKAAPPARNTHTPQPHCDTTTATYIGTYIGTYIQTALHTPLEKGKIPWLYK